MSDEPIPHFEVVLSGSDAPLKYQGADVDVEITEDGRLTLRDYGLRFNKDCSGIVLVAVAGEWKTVRRVNG